MSANLYIIRVMFDNKMYFKKSLSYKINFYIKKSNSTSVNLFYFIRQANVVKNNNMHYVKSIVLILNCIGIY